jgi:hypothetical protein
MNRELIILFYTEFNRLLTPILAKVLIDLISINGDNNLANLCRGDQTWKVRLIEEEFGRLMFDVSDISFSVCRFEFAVKR